MIKLIKDYFSKFHSKDSCKKNQSGFTLLELIVVIAIFGVLTTIVIFNYSDFESNIVTTNMAYEVALSVRQAQVFGLGVRGIEDNTNLGRDFNNSYGLYFNIQSGASSEYTFYADTSTAGSNAGKYDSGDKTLVQNVLGRGIKISAINYGDTEGQCTSANHMSVSFRRPNPDALIVKDNANQAAGFVQLTLLSPKGNNPDFQKYVVIRSSGQISVLGRNTCS